MRKLFLFFLFYFLYLPAFADTIQNNPDDGMTSSYRVAPEEENMQAANTNQSPAYTANTPSSEAAQSTDNTEQPAENTQPAPNPNTEAGILSSELSRYQQLANQPWDTIPHVKLKYHANNQTVLLLRTRLRATGDLSAEADTQNTLFDKNLVAAVKNFQARHGLKADGIVGSATLAELNVTPKERIQQITVNISRWQELSPQLRDRYIMVNIPDYKFHLVENGQEVLNMKAIVGKPDWPTPLVTSRVTRVVFNPFWNVPTNIANRDIIPKAIDDPYYLDDMHIKVYVDHGNGNEQVDQNHINWSRVEDSDNNPYIFRQDPGDDNSLGLVKFEFVNPYDVYLHDTPAKSLFDEDTRALSHGCIRLERPFDLVSYLMKDDIDWNSDRLQTILESHKTTYVRVQQPIPIFITYLTVWADENGVVNYRNDVYNRDSLGNQGQQASNDSVSHEANLDN